MADRSAFTARDDVRKNTQALSLQPDGRSSSRHYTIVPGSDDGKSAFMEGNALFDTFGLQHRPTVGVDWNKEEQRYQFFNTDVNGAFVTAIDIYDPVYGLPPPGAPESDGHFDGATEGRRRLSERPDQPGPGRPAARLGVRQDRFTYHDHDQDYDTTRFAQNATTAGVGLPGFLFIVGLTGAAIAWNDEGERLSARRLFVLPAALAKRPPLDPFALRDAAEHAVAGFAVNGVTPPAAATSQRASASTPGRAAPAPMRMRLRLARPLKLTFDLHSAAPGRTLTTWIKDLQTAGVWGWPMQALICLTGLVVLMPSITGVLVWRRKR